MPPSTPEDTAPITVKDKGYMYPMWWEDTRHGDVVEDEQGEIWQVVQGTTPDKRDGFVKVHKWTSIGWQATTIHVQMQELVHLRAVTEWEVPNE